MSRGFASRRLRIEPLERRELLAVFTVNNYDASGPGSLQDAIDNANMSHASEPDTINFIGLPPRPNGTYYFELASSAVFDEPVIIDGSTHGAYNPTTKVPVIEFTKPVSDLEYDGLFFKPSASNAKSVVKGVSITGFGKAGLHFESQIPDPMHPEIEPKTSDFDVINVWVGVRPSGVIKQNHKDGIFVDGPSNVLPGGQVLGSTIVGSLISDSGLSGIHVGPETIPNAGEHKQRRKLLIDGNTIRNNGDEPPDVEQDGIYVFGHFDVEIKNNVIIGNITNGILVLDVDGAAGQSVNIHDNFIGTDASGNVGLGNGLDGVRIEGSLNVTVTNNTISGNQERGIRLIHGGATRQTASGDSSHVTIQSNRIGVKPNGTGALGNNLEGIYIEEASKTLVFQNIIANNGKVGVVVAPSPTATPLLNRISQNSLYSNFLSHTINENLSGIDLGDNKVREANNTGDGDGGPNDLQNWPTVTIATRNPNTLNFHIQGTLNSLANTTYIVEIFGNPATLPMGALYECKQFLASAEITTDGSGNLSFHFTLPASSGLAVGQWITATVTQKVMSNGIVVGNTSEFSPAMKIFVLGDMNGDGVLNNLDIAPFTLALSDPAAFQLQYPNVPILVGDINHDNVLNNLDIAPFANLLSGGAGLMAGGGSTERLIRKQLRESLSKYGSAAEIETIWEELGWLD